MPTELPLTTSWLACVYVIDGIEAKTDERLFNGDQGLTCKDALMPRAQVTGRDAGS